MFDFKVHRNLSYKELKVKSMDATIFTGLLDEEEALELASKLINAAESLLPQEYCDQKEILIELIESLQ
jgi:hypothetical protein